MYPEVIKIYTKFFIENKKKSEEIKRKDKLDQLSYEEEKAIGLIHFETNHLYTDRNLLQDEEKTKDNDVSACM